MERAQTRRMGLLSWILIGLAVGILFGIFFKNASITLSWMGDLFLRLLKLLIVPLVFFSLMAGATSIGDPVKLGRVGMKIVALYLATTAVAVIIGLIMASIFTPYGRMKLPLVAGFKAPVISPVKDVLLARVPSNPLVSLMKGDILPIIVLALFFGILASFAREKGGPVIGLVNAAAEVMYKLTGIVMWSAPLGVFSLIATTVAKQGAQVLLPFLALIITCYMAYLAHAAIAYGSILKFLAKVRVFRFFKAISEAMIMACVTRSSNATLPVTMRVAEQGVGLPRRLISFTLPLGATINMDGTAIYQGITVLFIAGIYNVPLTFGHYLMIILLATLGTIGAAGVPGGGLIMLAMVLQGVGLPLEGLGLIAGTDVIMDMGRAALNITGHLVCTTAVASSEGEFSAKSFNAPADASTPFVPVLVTLPGQRVGLRLAGERLAPRRRTKENSVPLLNSPEWM